LFTIPQLKEIAGGMKIPDMMPAGYDPTYLFTLFIALGEKGRNLYLFKQIPFDMIYPFLYGYSFTLLFAYMFKLLFTRENFVRYLCLMPFVATLFDYAENITIAKLLYTFPDFAMSSALMASTFTVLKSSFTILTFVLVVAGVVSIVIKRFMHSFRPPNNTQTPS
jgi:hypothetical protein